MWWVIVNSVTDQCILWSYRPVHPMKLQTSASYEVTDPLQWRNNGGDSVSNHQPHDYLLNRLFRRRSKKTSKLRVTRLCVGNSPGTSEFPAQMASYAENVSIWWRHHAVHPMKLQTSASFETTDQCILWRYISFLKSVAYTLTHTVVASRAAGLETPSTEIYFFQDGWLYMTELCLCKPCNNLWIIIIYILCWINNFESWVLSHIGYTRLIRH